MKSASQEEEMTRWFTSDLHLGHVKINELAGRPFSSVEEMNEILVARWNDVVSPGDEVWVLGDFVMGKKDETLPLVSRLNGTKHLIPGNHDRVMPTDPQLARWLPRYREVGIIVHNMYEEIQFGKSGAGMCHFPFSGDSHGGDRYEELRPVDEGQLLLHGHVHEQWKQRGRMLNVGVDVWDFYPVHEETIRERFGV